MLRPSIGWVLGLGLLCLADYSYIHLKAAVAQVLIARAWESVAERSKPWPWADTWPIARLSMTSLDEHYYVLYGTSGNALAFGPGFEVGSSPPGKPGMTVIGGHRDTHFYRLKLLQPGDEIQLETRSGTWRYEVSETLVVDSRLTPLASLVDANNPLQLALITCYPFNTVNAGGPLRYVVLGKAVLPVATIVHNSSAH